MKYSAVNDGLYRYELEYQISDTGKHVSVIMVNPSKADGVIKDSTIRKLDGFGSRLGWSRYIVGNIHAFRATDIHDLRDAVDPIGPNNDAHLMAILLKTELTVVAWGTLGKLPPRLRNNWRKIVQLAQMIDRPLYCFGMCADGHPKHPVMIGYNSPLQIWNPPR